MSPLLSNNSSDSARCPFLTPEFQKVRENHTTLASTGCTKEFCQAGRAIHTDEPRIGENRAVHVVEQEAEGFLLELYNEDFFKNKEEFEERLKHVQVDIRNNAVEGIIREGNGHGLIGGNWTPTPRELKFGLRRAWRNARKCIMRSHCEELELCDLRAVTSSAGMARDLIRGISKAFNNGIIQPTAFVFPPRTPNRRGPMIWNHQLLAFAGYEAEDGSILGDPMSVQLTKEIIDLGWNPPEQRGRWDLLPLVTMADGDLPVIAELPSNLRSLVEIRHPHYSAEFEKLDLKWVPFPALTRLGFDIGGVQYTAAPFIGWFMDAEIGVRDLADSFRYNVLPDIIEALDLTRGRLVQGVDSFEDLPEYERLAMLSRAQSELNYAVHWSYLQAKINMTDTLTASMKWCHYDDEFKKKHGYRLPADPYWLAPPQGSIVPLWHRGGAPNYQPKPMICKHVEDPTKAWGREREDWSLAAKPLRSVALLGEQQHTKVQSSTNNRRLSILRKAVAQMPNKQLPNAASLKAQPQQYGAVIYKRDSVETAPTNTSIAILYCSAGTIAKKLANKLQERVAALIKGSSAVGLARSVESLDTLEASNLTEDKIILLVVSSTGQGDIPANGSEFSDMCSKLSLSSEARGFKFAIFGNGDSRYVATYNGAATKVEEHLRRIGGFPLAGGVFPGDTAIEAFPLTALSSWWDKLQLKIRNLAIDRLEKQIVCSVEECSSESDTPSESSTVGDTEDTEGTEDMEDMEDMQKYLNHGRQLRSDFQEATLIATSPEVDEKHQGSLRLTFDVGDTSYKDLSCIRVLPVSSPSKVARALDALCVDGHTKVDLTLANSGENPAYETFLTDFVDLELPFRELRWLRTIQPIFTKNLVKQALSVSSVLDVLKLLREEGILTYAGDNSVLRHELCMDMPLLQTRNFSVASSLNYLKACESTHIPHTAGNGNRVDIMVKAHPIGRFSNTFLRECSMPAALKVRFVDSISSDRLRDTHLSPLIVVATGAGFGPVRCLLQQRIYVAQNEFPAGHLPTAQKLYGISLFLGFKSSDIAMTTEILDEATKWKLIDTLCIVPSNAEKVRIHDKLKKEDIRQELRLKLLEENGMVYVCTNPAAAKATKTAFADVLGGNVARLLRERYIEEVF
ncbi:MAG: hypothetical protein M1812_006700 [Candelaria pacifica]|nr:MAG: hypothetical protein M1812_006700 [Candelaria pacifica]